MTKIDLPPYTGGTATARQIEEAIDDIRSEISREDSEALEHITVTEEEQGVDPILTPILITIVSNVGTNIVLAAWHRLKAKVEHRLGENAIGKETEDGSQADQ